MVRDESRVGFCLNRFAQLTHLILGAYYFRLALMPANQSNGLQLGK